MGEVLSPDICVVGAGAGGVAAALAAARHGVPVVLVEKGEIGGAFLRGGGLAAKALGAIARRAEAFGQAKTFGLNAPRPKVDFYRVHDRIRGVLDAAAPNFSPERLTGLGVKVVRRAARFTDARTLAVGDITVKARRFIIATGSLPAVPPIPGLAETPYLTPETIFELLVCPKHLAVIGAAGEALELAQAYRRLGAEVTVLDAGPLLAGHDPDCAAIVLGQLEAEGVQLRGGAAISRIKAARSRIQIFLGGEGGEERIEATHLLLAAGRKPNIAELDLPAAKIVSDSGRIIVDRNLKTSNSHVYAIGGAIAAPAPATHRQAELAVRHALTGGAVTFDERQFPRLVFTQPELAEVGLSETQVRKAGGSFRVLRAPFRENDRARADGEAGGHVKIITSKRGKILGAAIVGPQAAELIAPWALAVQQGLNIAALGELPASPLTLTDTGRQAAASFASGLARPAIRRIMGFLRFR